MGFQVSGYYQAVLNNLLLYAQTGGAAGDPHVVDFFGNHYDLPGIKGESSYYRLYADASLHVNINIENHFIKDVAVQIFSEEGNHEFLATLSIFNQPEFYLDNVKLQVPGSYLNGLIVLSRDVSVLVERPALKELGSHLSVAAVIQNFGIIAGGNMSPLLPDGFFNVEMRHRAVSVSQRDEIRSILQTPLSYKRDSPRDFSPSLLSSLWE